MGEAIVITSGKGGVGKTTTTANIGTALALQDKKVCLIDTDIGLRNLDVILGLENRIIFDIIDVIEGRCKLQAALVKDKRFDCLHLLPAAQSSDKNEVTPEGVKELVDELKPDYDYILIDCPAGIEQGYKNAVAGADKAIVVTTPEKSSVRDADRIIGLLEQEDLESPHLVINRIRKHMMDSGDMLDVDDIVSTLSVELLGVIMDDEDVIRASHHGNPVAFQPDTKASICYRNISRRILGESVPLMSFDEDKGIMVKVKKILGMK
ncbi:septum site-determining protein MinD [Alkalibacillus haloalkaliphilus]|uniref:Septum site-determining protein MinD n=1 Tax=Alkalibacillus haloalkaliphilus TaxID=94136 RepID=A0A511W3Y0_9BACI|nr:septum site-determining protein MinD [Alkalibacillus haloalkaliphilus]MDV2581120.1 septum site-determining protein MinD [Alkalibacillus haloalkaliphilus]GEN45804.1 site-determining protein [Alkalibacillus haloalkaliphilus]